MRTQKAMFEVLSPSNSATITMNDNAGVALPAKWIIGRDARAVAYAILSYAKINNIAPSRVGYSVLFDDSHQINERA